MSETPKPNLIRQYRIITKTPDSDPVQLQPTVHADLYNIPEVRAAVDFCRDNVNVEMIGIRLSTRFYSVVVVYDEQLMENHFAFD